MATIFVRERRKVEKGEKKPRFRVVAVEGKELKIYERENHIGFYTFSVFMTPLEGEFGCLALRLLVFHR